MTLPFTIEQFLDVFRRYNDAVWPLQWILNALAIVALVAAMRRSRWSSRAASRVTSGILAALWLWVGIAYHVAFFRTINPAAWLFAIIFVGEGALIAWLGLVRPRLEFELRPDAGSRIGVALIAYALIAYPVIGYALGHRYPSAPTFGVPCPTTIFTFGMLLLCPPPRPRAVFVIPAAWAIIASVAAIELGMWEDMGLVAAAITATVMALLQRSDKSRPAAQRHVLTPVVR
jgi:hypothetical protein